jgi:NAD(P)H-nitrite reductase large subunit
MQRHHVIVGGGPAATNAVETIRLVETELSRVTLISDEPAHSRMAIPYWIAGSIPREQTQTGDADYFRNLKVDTKFGQRVLRVDPSSKTVMFSNGQSMSFDNLLIATGSRPQTLPIPGADLPGVQPLWTLAHAESVLQAAERTEPLRVALIGAGFIGFIVLGAMFKRRWQLTVIEREQQVLPRMLDETGAALVQSWLDQKNVAVQTGTSVEAIRQIHDGTKIVQLANREQVEADLVVIATGIRPNLELLEGAGIETDEGILVNDRMQTNVPAVYAAGDVAQAPVMLDDSPAIHAVQPTAVDHGRIAGANMAGHEVRYPGSLLMNVVDVCGLQCASFGRWNDPDAEQTVIQNPGSSIYRKLLWNEDQLVGALFCGRADDLGMLTDVGMIKGLMQTRTHFGPWKSYLSANPFDVRRAFVATGVASKLAKTTLLGRPTRVREFRFQNAQPAASVGKSHAVFTGKSAERVV